jgi:hypothetical protein
VPKLDPVECVAIRAVTVSIVNRAVEGDRHLDRRHFDERVRPGRFTGRSREMNARAAALAPTDAERQFLSRGGRGARA